MKLKHPAPEENFLIESEDVPQKVPEPPSPLSKKVGIRNILLNFLKSN